MAAFENGGHAYHATMPTDALLVLREVMQEAEAIGFDKLEAAQTELAQKCARSAAQGFPSVAAAGFEAPGVVVSYTTHPEIQNGKAFAAQGMQIAAGVPLQCGERRRSSHLPLRPFRLGQAAKHRAHRGRICRYFGAGGKRLKPILQTGRLKRFRRPDILLFLLFFNISTIRPQAVIVYMAAPHRRLIPIYQFKTSCQGSKPKTIRMTARQRGYFLSRVF